MARLFDFISVPTSLNSSYNHFHEFSKEFRRRGVWVVGYEPEILRLRRQMSGSGYALPAGCHNFAELEA